MDTSTVPSEATYEAVREVHDRLDSEITALSEQFPVMDDQPQPIRDALARLSDAKSFLYGWIDEKP